jgi:hypothetical protein
MLQSAIGHKTSERIPVSIDQTSLGQHIQEQMAAIESDPNVPDQAEIGGIITIVEVVGPDDGSGQQTRNLRVRSNAHPHVSIGLLEEAKMVQMMMIQGGGQAAADD